MAFVLLSSALNVYESLLENLFGNQEQFATEATQKWLTAVTCITCHSQTPRARVHYLSLMKCKETPARIRRLVFS